MADGEFTSPPELGAIHTQASGLEGQLQGFRWSTMMDIADDQHPLMLDRKIIQMVSDYIRRWVIGDAEVRAVAQQWSSLSADFKNVYNDCNMQLGLLKTHWTGDAAVNFSTYSDNLLGYFSTGSQSMSDIAGQLNDQATNLTKLRNDVVAQQGNTTLRLLDAAIGTANALANGISATELVEAATGVLVPLAVAQYCMNAVATLSEKLTEVLICMNDMDATVKNYLAEINNMGVKMQSTAKGLSVPPEPPGLGDTHQWKPA